MSGFDPSLPVLLYQRGRTSEEDHPARFFTVTLPQRFSSSSASPRYACDPFDSMSYRITGLPWDGLSERRTFRGTTFSKTLSSKWVRISLATLEERWTEHGFARIHRSYLVALRHISEVRWDAGHTTVTVGGKVLAVSRRHARELRERLVNLPGQRS